VLTYWAADETVFKILRRIAAQLLPIQASAAFESLILISGNVCPPEISTMNGEMITVPNSLNYWLKDEYIAC